LNVSKNQISTQNITNLKATYFVWYMNGQTEPYAQIQLSSEKSNDNMLEHGPIM